MDESATCIKLEQVGSGFMTRQMPVGRGSSNTNPMNTKCSSSETQTLFKLPKELKMLATVSYLLWRQIDLQGGHVCWIIL